MAALATGVGLRTIRLASVPAGTYCDEACNGYDAYSLLTTGRDHHGNFLPIVVQGFNDARMPLFDYSLVPLVAAFGMKTAVVRLGAALWGIIDLFAITAMAALMFGMPGAAIAALLASFSPWHLPLSRYGVEMSAVSATVSLAMLCFLLWLRQPRALWLMLSAVGFGLTLYTNPITKAFTPLMMALLALLYRRRFSVARRSALMAAAIVAAMAAPQAVLLLRNPAELQAHFRQQLIVHSPALCSNCAADQRSAARRPSFGSDLAHFGVAWMSYFNPGFLFRHGDRGGQWELLFVPGFGMLLPEQALLVALALAALVQARRRKLVLMLLGWLMLAALPAALLVPAGVFNPAHGSQLPTPFIFIRSAAPADVSSASLLAHPEARHDVLAISPWVLLSALGFVAMLDWLGGRPQAQGDRGGPAGRRRRIAWHAFRAIVFPRLPCPLGAILLLRHGSTDGCHWAAR